MPEIGQHIVDEFGVQSSQSPRRRCHREDSSISFIIHHTGDWNEPLEIALWSYEGNNNTTDETITNTAKSTDANYAGITVANLTVNVVDIDTPQVTKAWTQPGDRQLTATEQSDRLQRAVESTWRRLQHQRPAGDDNQWFDYDLHHSEPHQRDGIHGAGNGNENREQRRPMVRRRDLHSNGDTTTSGRTEPA